MSTLTQDSTITLNDGNKIPIIGMGVYQTAPGVTEDVVYNALKVGYRHIDSAQVYGNEAEVHKGVMKWVNESESNKREDVFYTTKIKDTFHGYELTKKSLLESLDRVSGFKYINLVLVHSPQSNREKRLGTWKLLQEAVDSGIVKSIGVSNYGERHLQELLDWEDLKYKPVINQIELSPWLMRSDLVNFCRSKDINLELYSPLTRGNKLGDEGLVAIASKYKKSPAQILIRWSLQQGFICLPKTEKLERASGNLDVFDFNIDEDDLESLSHRDAYIPYCWDPVHYEG